MVASSPFPVDVKRGENIPPYITGRNLEGVLDENSIYSLKKKYLLRDENGDIIETPNEAIYRMARTMAEVERQYGHTDQEVEDFTKKFYDVIDTGAFSPAGRIWTNAGTEIKGLFNCYVLPVEDSLEDIYDSVRKAAIIHKNGGGTGYNFSKLRPRGTFVQASKGIASGVVSFIGQFDKETEVINSGNRRGANMGIVDVTHPDVLDFIYAKTKRGEITNFNVSVGITERFMKAVEAGDYYDLEFPEGVPFNHERLTHIIKNVEENKIGGSDVGKLPKPASLKFDSDKVVFGETKILDSQTGDVAGRVSERGVIQLYAPYVFDTIAKLACETADPGMIFLDRINEFNPLPNKGPIKATNPCGEQPLHPFDACNLGSIILSNMVKPSSNGRYEVDYDKLEYTVSVATRFMDNVNDANKGPIAEIEATVLQHRRIGMGVMGWADMLAKLGLAYDSEEAYELGRNVMKRVTDSAKRASVEIAKEKGVFPAFEGSRYDDGTLENRVRNVERTTIAPTGTISMVYNVSSSVEPLFAIAYSKNIRGGDTLLYTVKPFAEECEKRGLDIKKIAALIEANHGSVQGIKEVPEDIQRIFKTSHDLHYEAHIKMQAAFQEYTDNAVSKTINMPNDASVEDVRNAYFLAWKHGLKGITVYIDGTKEVQVLETGHKKKDENKKPSKRLPDIMPAVRVRQRTPFGNMHTTFVYDAEDGRVLENFAQLGRAGEVVSADLEAISRLSSIHYRNGGSIAEVIEQLSGIGSNEGIVSRDGTISSVPDAYARALIKFQTLREKGYLKDIMDGTADLEAISNEISDEMRTGSNGFSNSSSKGAVKPKCPDCGKSTIIFESGCNKCTSCGYSKCG